MKRIKVVLKKIFFLPPLPTILIAVPSFAFVFVMLGIGDHSILSYIAYILSAYAMIIVITGMPGIIEAIRSKTTKLPLVKKLRSTSLGNRLLGDAVFRSEITLHGGLIVNILYAALNLISGIRYRSTWFIALAFYYAGQDIPAELMRYRACGIILLLMNQALVGIIVYMVTQDRGFSYPGLMIYAMAMYAFYITITATINVVKFRKRGSPLLSAAKVISLTAALVSMLSLETAMLARFGSDDPEFRRIMLAASGGVVCAVVLTMAVYMIAISTKKLKKLRNNNLEI